MNSPELNSTRLSPRDPEPQLKTPHDLAPVHDDAQSLPSNVRRACMTIAVTVFAPVVLRDVFDRSYWGRHETVELLQTI
jgi:hypothetical protein